MVVDSGEGSALTELQVRETDKLEREAEGESRREGEGERGEARRTAVTTGKLHPSRRARLTPAKRLQER
jgi:hypothetical protein